MKDKFIRFMMGRYGLDQFSKFLLGVSFIFLLMNIFGGHGLFYILAVLALIYCYFRIFSKNHPKRYEENVKYLYYRDKVKNTFSREKSNINQRKQFHIYTCKDCGQKIRIPRGKGRIEVTCPKCGYKFVKRS